jgi:ectoine hydroxylase-related dioxygenase (phytanoyl-CoA dioxygenase family)
MCRSEAGYEIRRDVLTPQECDEITLALSSDSLPRSRAGARHLMSHPVVARVAGDRRLMEITREWAGSEATPFRATLFEKTSLTNWLIPWHQDTALPMVERVEREGWGPWSEKAGVTYAHAPASALSEVIALRLHLDDSTPKNGPLRVVPSSHRAGVLSDREVDECVLRGESVECCVGRGGVIVMRPLIVHASSKACSVAPRRVLHIEYARSLVLEGGVRLAVS